MKSLNSHRSVLIALLALATIQNYAFAEITAPFTTLPDVTVTSGNQIIPISTLQPAGSDSIGFSAYTANSTVSLLPLRLTGFDYSLPPGTSATISAGGTGSGSIIYTPPAGVASQLFLDTAAAGCHESDVEVMDKTDTLLSSIPHAITAHLSSSSALFYDDSDIHCVSGTSTKDVTIPTSGATFVIRTKNCGLGCGIDVSDITSGVPTLASYAYSN